MYSQWISIRERRTLMTDQQGQSDSGAQVREHEQFNPVQVSDSVGAIFLGLLALILLGALLRAQARNRRLLIQLVDMDELGEEDV
jgi:hypothetical protein